MSTKTSNDIADMLNGSAPAGRRPPAPGTVVAPRLVPNRAETPVTPSVPEPAPVVPQLAPVPEAVTPIQPEVASPVVPQPAPVTPIPKPSSDRKPIKQTYAIDPEVDDMLKNLSHWKRKPKNYYLNKALVAYLVKFPESTIPIPEDDDDE